jgi:hypothetical protein
MQSYPFLRKLHNQGYIIVPTEQTKNPRAASGFSEKRDMDVLNKLAPAHGVGVICGKNDKGNEYFYCIDFDEYKGSITAYKDYKSIIDVELIDKCYVESTQSGGYHLWFKSTLDFKSEKLARIDGKEIIELRGYGNYAIIAPTEGYVKIEGLDLVDLPLLEDNDVEDLIAA